MVANVHKRLSLGQTVLSGACLEQCNQLGVSPELFFNRQRRCDWGEVNKVIALQNFDCLRSGGPIAGKHTLENVTLYVITLPVNQYGLRTETRLLTDEEYSTFLDAVRESQVQMGDWT